MNAATAPNPASSSAADLKAATPAQRLVSLDAYRGFVMLLMVAEVLHFGRVARAFPESGFWAFLASQQSHREWVGCSLHDLIQPSFTFLAGASLPFSIASRLAKGQGFATMIGHALWRSMLLIWLGIFLRSVGASQTNFTFEDTLTQIGLGYTFAFLLAFLRERAVWIGIGVVLVGYWAAFALYPAPGPNFDWKAVGVPPDWPHHVSGFAQHWDKNSNLAAAFDRWFLNLFPRKSEFLYNGGGYLTLSFIPTLGTMLFGVLAGKWLRSDQLIQQKLLKLITVGMICLSLATAIHFIGLCPIVKRIWTPSWTIFSAGWAFLILAAFFAVIDMQGWKGWAFPLVVIGMNSIAAYCMAWLFKGFISAALRRHLGPTTFQVFGTVYEPLLLGAATLLVLWLLLYAMYRRGLFLRI